MSKAITIGGEEQLIAMAVPNPLMTSDEVGVMLGLCQRTLKRWRDEARPRITFIVFEGGDIRYRAEEVEGYLGIGDAHEQSTLFATDEQAREFATEMDVTIREAANYDAEPNTQADPWLEK